MVYKYLLCLLGIILALPILVLIVLAFTLPITFSGIGYLLACILIIAGFIISPWTSRHYLKLVLVGVILLLLIASVRHILGTQNTASNLKMITLPQEKGARWISYLIDEQDSLIFGETLFHFLGGDSNNEHAGIASALVSTYSQMHVDGVFPSPIVGTYLNLQGPTHFDATIIEPQDQAEPEFGVIFLHGYMGNVSAQCWVIGQAVREVGGMTICPSTGWRGEWWQPQGQAILNTTFDYLRDRGIQRIFLGGYSNGGFGIGRLASLVEDQKGLSGLFFIDGFANSVSIRQIGLPVLVIQGTLDERVPVSDARQFADDIGELGTYVELNADHFLIMKQPEHVQAALAQWLADRQPGK